MKRCPRCLATKDSEAFYRSKHSADGLDGWCKSCRKDQHAQPEYREQVRSMQATDAYKATRRAWLESEEGRAKHNAQSRITSERHAGQVRARSAVMVAVKAGELVRQPCEACGLAESEAHHDSYEPEAYLKVRWLCEPHHKEHHRLNGYPPEPKRVPRPKRHGETNPRAKLTAVDVRIVRDLLAGGASNGEVASRFGVTPSNISAIRRGKSWRNESSDARGLPDIDVGGGD